MRLTFNSEIKALLSVIRSELDQSQDLYIVGGAVRDALIGYRINDLDLTLSINPIILAKKVAKHLKVAYFVLDDERHTARVLYRDPRGDPFSLDFVQFSGKDLTSDLENRDFTINAMAVSIHDLDTLIDPLGGRIDLQEDFLRPCSSYALMDDPLRVLRGVRMACQFGFDYGSALNDMMLAAADHLPDISYERQRDELFKILEGPYPASGLLDCYKFKVFNTMIPQLLDQAAIPPSPPHVFSLFEHTLKVVEQFDRLLRTLQTREISDDAPHWWKDEALSAIGCFSTRIKTYFEREITPGRSIRGLALLGALLHDIGKPKMMTTGEDGRLHFYGHDQVGADMSWDLAKRMILSNAEADWLRKLVLNHMRLLPMMNNDGLPSRRSIYRFFTHTKSVGVATILLSLADTLATYGETLNQAKWHHEVAVSKVLLSSWWDEQHTVVAPLPLLDGNDLQQLFRLDPGKKIGNLLEALTEAQACGEVSTQEEAKVFIQRQLN